MERWKKLCNEPLDRVEAAEELLDRMGDSYGWRSPEAFEAALLSWSDCADARREPMAGE